MPDNARRKLVEYLWKIRKVKETRTSIEIAADNFRALGVFVDFAELRNIEQVISSFHENSGRILL